MTDEVGALRRRRLAALGLPIVQCDEPDCPRIEPLVPASGGAGLLDAPPGWFIEAMPGRLVVLCPTHRPGEQMR